MDIEESSGIRSSFLATRDHLHYLRLLLREQLRAAPSDAAFATSGFQARPRSLSQHRPLELRERADHLHHHSAGWRCGVYCLGETAKASLRFLDSFHDRQHIPQGPRQAIQLPDNQNITFAEVVEQSLQLRTVPSASGSLLPEDALAPRRLQGGGLRRCVLFVG
jgi:hypothetical protein